VNLIFLHGLFLAPKLLPEFIGFLNQSLILYAPCCLPPLPHRYLLSQHNLTAAKHVIITQFPRKELANNDVSLQELGLTSRQVLNVEVLHTS